MRVFRLGALMLCCAMPAAASAGGCTASTTGMAFGAYRPVATSGRDAAPARTSTATVTIVCTGIAAPGSYALSLGPTAESGSTHSRVLSNPAGGPGMQFNIYTDPGYTTVWGDEGGGTMLTGAIPLGDSRAAHTVYGKVPPGQTRLRAGSFSGSLTMTLTYNP